MSNEPTNPEFTDNMQTIPADKTLGLKDPDGNTIGIGIPQGEDIVVKNSEGPDYFFYGILEDVHGAVTSVSWDGFIEGPKDGVIVIHTQKGINQQMPDQTFKEVDVALPKGAYKLVLRDDPTPRGSILGETEFFCIY